VKRLAGTSIMPLLIQVSSVDIAKNRRSSRIFWLGRFFRENLPHLSSFPRDRESIALRSAMGRAAKWNLPDTIQSLRGDAAQIARNL
jgi:hypothetical protein